MGYGDSHREDGRDWRGDWRDLDSDERHVAVTHGVRSTAGIPDDAQRMGLTRNTVEGALVSFCGSLDSARLSHRVVAWVLLALLVGPWVWSLLGQLVRVL